VVPNWVFKYLRCVPKGGSTYLAKGESELAIGHFKKAVEIDSNLHTTMALIGNWYANRELFDEAIDWYDRALQAEPDHHDYSRNLGRTLLRKQRYTDAIKFLHRSVKSNPDDAIAHYFLGLALFRSGDEASARSSWRQACDLGFEEGCQALRNR